MTGGSDSLNVKVARLENFLNTLSDDEAPSVVAQIKDLSAKVGRSTKSSDIQNFDSEKAH